MVLRRPTTENAEAFSWFFVAAYPSLVRSLSHLVPRPDAEDIAQEAFVRLHKHWDKVSHYDQPDAWLRRVAVNLAMTRARREGKRRAREARAAALTRATGSGAARPPGEDFEQHADVLAALRTLSPRDQALTVLFYFEDRPLPEVADILGMSHGAAKVALHRARSRLAAQLDDPGTQDHFARAQAAETPSTGSTERMSGEERDERP